jgi:hypothetical protein
MVQPHLEKSSLSQTSYAFYGGLKGKFPLFKMAILLLHLI